MQGIQGAKGEGKGGRIGSAKIHQRNNFGPPWQTCRRLREGGSVGRWASSRNRRGEEGRVGKSACWDGVERLPDGKMNSCGRWKLWV